MENELIKRYTVPASACDAEGLLSIPGVFDCFMDLAAEHAAQLGVGFSDMAGRGCYWIAVRTRVRFLRRPRMGETVRAETWPGAPGLAKSDRFYRITKGDELLAEGRTEWAAQDTDTGAIRRTDSYGWPKIETRSDRVCGEPYTRFTPLTDGEVFTRTVRSTDIDTGRHMNNVAYIRMLLGTFSTEELAVMDIRGLEASYRSACLEGEALTILRSRSEQGWELQVNRPDGTPALRARILVRP